MTVPSELEERKQAEHRSMSQQRFLSHDSRAIASLTIDTDRGPVQVRDTLIDTGGSKSLASRHLLTNIKLAKSYGNEPIRMVTVNGISPDYSH